MNGGMNGGMDGGTVHARMHAEFEDGPFSNSASIRPRGMDRLVATIRTKTDLQLGASPKTIE